MAEPDRTPRPIPADVAESLARIEEASMPSHWAVLMSAAAGTQSVHGAFADPIEALYAADGLATELRELSQSLEEDCAAQLWQVTVVPYYPARVQSTLPPRQQEV